MRYEQASGEAFRAKLPEKMRGLLGQAGTLINEWEYFGPRGREAVEWTRDVVERKGQGQGLGRLGSWVEFLEREGPWFV